MPTALYDDLFANVETIAAPNQSFPSIQEQSVNLYDNNPANQLFFLDTEDNGLLKYMGRKTILHGIKWFYHHQSPHGTISQSEMIRTPDLGIYDMQSIGYFDMVDSFDFAADLSDSADVLDAGDFWDLFDWF
jgi:hypothetical protein